MIVDYIVSFNGLDWLWEDHDPITGYPWGPDYLQEMGTFAVVELCGC